MARREDAESVCGAPGRYGIVCPLYDGTAGGCTRRRGGCYGSLLAEALQSPEKLSMFLAVHGMPRESNYLC